MAHGSLPHPKHSDSHGEVEASVSRKLCRALQTEEVHGKDHCEDTSRGGVRSDTGTWTLLGAARIRPPAQFALKEPVRVGGFLLTRVNRWAWVEDATDGLEDFLWRGMPTNPLPSEDPVWLPAFRM
jgi:hypothetical protein